MKTHGLILFEGHLTSKIAENRFCRNRRLLIPEEVIISIDEVYRLTDSKTGDCNRFEVAQDDYHWTGHWILTLVEMDTGRYFKLKDFVNFDDENDTYDVLFAEAKQTKNRRGETCYIPIEEGDK